MCENSALPSGINYTLKYIQKENSYFKLVIFYNVSVLTVFD